jgi:hypothetical protein
MSRALSDAEVEKLGKLIQILGDDCATFSAPKLAERLGIDGGKLFEYLRQHFIRHNPHRILDGTEALTPPVLILTIPDPPKADKLLILSANLEYAANYKQFQAPQTVH